VQKISEGNKAGYMASEIYSESRKFSGESYLEPLVQNQCLVRARPFWRFGRLEHALAQPGLSAARNI